MLYPIKVVDIELSRPLIDIQGLEGYMGLQALVRLYGVPLGYVKAPITSDRCTAQTLSKLILEQHSWKIINCLLENGLAAPQNPEGLCLEDLFDVPPPECQEILPLVTVAVCTRDRTADLALCLDSLSHLDYAHLDILVVDNAPTDEATKELVQTKYSNVRYVCEPRPGLDWARNRAIIEAKGEIIAYTDDDVIVDSGWVKALAQVFAENPEVMAVTGLVVPYELETEAQVLFEHYGGFGRGVERKWYRLYPGDKMPWQWLGTGQFGTGANMAYRRRLFDEIGYFDPALDVGTVTNGGGDLEMFFRVLKEEHTLVYEPKAMVRHRHRRDYAKLRSQLENNSLGFFSYCVRTILTYPEEWQSFLRLAIWWVVSWNLKRLWVSLKYPTRFPRDFVLAEFNGCFPGLTRYQKARKNVAKITDFFGELEKKIDSSKKIASSKPQNLSLKANKSVAVRTIDFSQPIRALTDVTDYSNVRIFVTWQQKLIGSIDIRNIYQPISASHLKEAIVEQLGLKLLEPSYHLDRDNLWAEALSNLTKHFNSTKDNKLSLIDEHLSANITVSIVVATYDRPEDLRKCLSSLIAQESARQVEIIVVDNNPSSGLTSTVVTEFPEVKLITEKRKGLSYARNAGIVSSQGDIIITTDDDVTMSRDWLEKLVAPFARPEVMIVTGNVLPLELETITQRFFERYGGLGRGFKPFEVNGEWFESFPCKPLPTWHLGATANAAFRASIFVHSQIGLIDEALGAGTPTGCSEDTYVFYKVLKAGYTMVYEPNAYVWHKHRRDMAALRRQIYNYSKGHVAYHLTTCLNDGDLRAIVQIFAGLPYIHCQRIYYWLRGWSDYPLSLIFVEIAGNFAGPWSLWRSRQRVRREGRSTPYILPQKRPAIIAEKLNAKDPEYALR
jgi:glycosyltransferase involved in cell wall biosynthesis